MRSHLTVVAVLHLVLDALCVLGGLAFIGAWVVGASLLGGVAGAEHGAATGGAAAAALSLPGVVIGCGLLAPGLPGLLGGLGLLRGRSWARWVLVVVSALQLPNFPVGTAIGAYSLWVLLHPDTDAALRAEAPLEY
jgi:hypothetical protein